MLSARSFVSVPAHIYDRHKVNYHSNGVGVYNVQKRLKLYNKKSFALFVLQTMVNRILNDRLEYQFDQRDM